MDHLTPQALLNDLLDPDPTGEAEQRLRESLIKLIWQVNYQAIIRDMAKTWEEIETAWSIGDEQTRQAAADRYEELLLQRANPSMIRMTVVEMVLSEVTAAAIEAVREQFRCMGKSDLLPEMEENMNDQLRHIFDQLYEQSTLDPTADQSSSMVS